MKNNKIDSDILDDNYFPEEKSQLNFFKIIGFSFLSIISFGLLSLVMVLAFTSYFDENTTQEFAFILYLPFIFSTMPYVYVFYLEYKSGNLNSGRWELWVAIFTFLFISIVGIFHLLL